MRCYHYVAQDHLGRRLISGSTTSLERAQQMSGLQGLREVPSKDLSVRRFVDTNGNSVLIGDER